MYYFAMQYPEMTKPTDTTLDQQLNERGFALIQGTFDSEALTVESLTDHLLALGHARAKTAGYRVLKAASDERYLPVHNEGIFLSSGLIRYFALGCLMASTTGGQTRLFDARLAANIITNKYPEVSTVAIDYQSRNYRDQSAVHTLVESHPRYGSVLRYRAKTPENEIVSGLPHGMKEDDLYALVDGVLDVSLALSHSWEAGDILLVNNLITLHDRRPFVGERQMVRVRYDDPMHPTHPYEGMA